MSIQNSNGTKSRSYWSDYMTPLVSGIMFLMLSLSSTVKADSDTSVVVWLTSYHSSYPYGIKPNEYNPGIGIIKKFTPNRGITFGTYRNSFGRASHYIGHILEYRSEYADVGVSTIAVTGYDIMDSALSFPVVPQIAVHAAVKYKRLGMQLVVPLINNMAVIGYQLRYDL